MADFLPKPSGPVSPFCTQAQFPQNRISWRALLHPGQNMGLFTPVKQCDFVGILTFLLAQTMLFPSRKICSFSAFLHSCSALGLSLTRISLLLIIFLTHKGFHFFYPSAQWTSLFFNLYYALDGQSALYSFPASSVRLQGQQDTGQSEPPLRSPTNPPPPPNVQPLRNPPIYSHPSLRDPWFNYN